MDDPMTIAAIASVAAAGGSSLMQLEAGKTAVREAEVSAQIEETAATQREADRKGRLAQAMAAANAQAGASGIRAFEGSPLTVLQQSIQSEETATERDAFNTRISALRQRASGSSALYQARMGAGITLLKGGVRAASLTAGDSGDDS